VSDVPHAIQILRNPDANLQNPAQFTFVFDAKIAGLPGTVLWDSAATLNFVSEEFVRRHGLPVHPHKLDLHLADGTVKNSAGFVKVRLAIQGYRQEEKLVISELSPGFDVFLGEKWNASNGVVADYGYMTDSGPVQPSLWLRRAKVKLHPSKPSKSDISTV
jgi:hypothetical protein